MAWKTVDASPSDYNSFTKLYWFLEKLESDTGIKTKDIERSLRDIEKALAKYKSAATEIPALDKLIAEINETLNHWFNYLVDYRDNSTSQNVFDKCQHILDQAIQFNSVFVKPFSEGELDQAFDQFRNSISLEKIDDRAQKALSALLTKDEGILINENLNALMGHGYNIEFYQFAKELFVFWGHFLTMIRHSFDQIGYLGIKQLLDLQPILFNLKINNVRVSELFGGFIRLIDMHRLASEYSSHFSENPFIDTNFIDKYDLSNKALDESMNLAKTLTEDNNRDHLQGILLSDLINHFRSNTGDYEQRDSPEFSSLKSIISSNFLNRFYYLKTVLTKENKKNRNQIQLLIEEYESQSAALNLIRKESLDFQKLDQFRSFTEQFSKAIKDEEEKNLSEIFRFFTFENFVQSREKTTSPKEDAPSPWTLEIDIKDEKINFREFSFTLYAIAESLSSIPGLEIELEEIKVGSIYMRLKLIFKDAFSKEMTKEILETTSQNMVKEDEDIDAKFQDLAHYYKGGLKKDEARKALENLLPKKVEDEISALSLEERKLAIEEKKLAIQERKEILISQRLENLNRVSQIIEKGLDPFLDLDIIVNGFSYIRKNNGKYFLDNDIESIDSLDKKSREE